VGVGSEKVTAASRAINVRSTGAADTAAAFSKMSIKPVIEIIGLAGRTIEVTCRFGDTALPLQTRKITAEKARETFEFTHIPLDTGFHRLRVIAKVVGKVPKLKSLGGLPTAEKLVQITDREIRLLYVEGKFRYETKYIAQAIGTAERFVLHRRILLQPLRGNKAPPLGEKLDDWLRYHAIIFGDVAATHFTAKQLECIKQVVSEYGKGFCMIGGDKSFGRGGWVNTPIADIMPVDLARSGGNISKDVKPRPTTAGKNAELMQIGKAGQGATEAWACLDSMPGANLLAGVKPAAAVLAETADGKPLIVAQTFGKGRTLAIAFDTTWRWVLSPGEIDTGEMQKRFWRQVGLYLAAPKGNVWIHTDKTTYDLAGLAKGRAVVTITAGVEDAAGLPLPKAALRVKLTGPDGNSIPISLAGDKHIKRGTIGTLSQPGMYSLSAETTSGGKTLTAEHKFQIVQRDIESAEVLANFALLKRMAARGNGKFVPLRDLPELLGKLKLQTHPKTRDVVTTQLLLGPWRWWLISLLIALLLAEWIIRKRKGLV
ncbi:MAG: glutamine amidotransferase, partial [Phycisphaerae bacterium]|nr:glutamine amidotransferase [Phycisphaerae bacterium]